MVMSDLEIDRARATAHADRVLSMSHYTTLAEKRLRRTPAPGNIIAEVLRDLRIRHVNVPSGFSTGVADRLRVHGIRVDAAPGSLFPERIHKSPGEVKHIVDAMRATEAGMQCAIDVLRRASRTAGWCSTEEAHCRGRAPRRQPGEIRGCVPAHTIGCRADTGVIHTTSAAVRSAREARHHRHLPALGKTGYFADITRTVVKGTPRPHVREMYDAASPPSGALRMIAELWPGTFTVPYSPCSKTRLQDRQYRRAHAGLLSRNRSRTRARDSRSASHRDERHEAHGGHGGHGRVGTLLRRNRRDATKIPVSSRGRAFATLTRFQNSSRFPERDRPRNPAKKGNRRPCLLQARCGTRGLGSISPHHRRRSQPRAA